MNKIMGFFNQHVKWIYTMAGVCIVCALLLPYGKRLYDQTPHYEWETQQMGSLKSDEPLGAKYLDYYLHDYWKGKVVVASDADSAFARFKNSRANFLFVNSANQEDDSAHLALFINKANIGNRILFTSTEAEYARLLLLNMDEGVRAYFDIHDFLNREDEIRHVNLQLRNGSGKRKQNSIKIWENMITETVSFSLNDTLPDNLYMSFYGELPFGGYTPLISLTDECDVAVRRDIGNGCVTMCFNNFFFTNYAVQNKDLRIGMEHIMENTFDRSLPLVIIYNDDDSNVNMADGTTFMVMLKHPATALFLWLLCAALVLAILVNTRRRRRAETGRKRVQNSSINYIRHLATIYTEETDYSELLRIEKRVLLYRLRKEYYFDMRTRNFSKVSQFAGIVATTRKLNDAHVREVFSTLEELTANGVQVDAKSYRLCLKELDEIVRPPSI